MKFTLEERATLLHALHHQINRYATFAKEDADPHWPKALAEVEDLYQRILHAGSATAKAHIHDWAALNFSSGTDVCDCGATRPNPEKAQSEKEKKV